MKLENSFERIYPFTTENIDGYMESMDLSDKSVLTVGSSLDQAFNAEIFGASSITILDINPYVEKYYELKKAAIIQLSRKEFINFLISDFLNKKSYSKVRDYMKYSSEEITEFWDEKVFNEDKTEIREKYFSGDVLSEETIIKSNPYLRSNKLYNRLKNRLFTSQLDINIKYGSLLDLNDYLDEDENFDRMIFSNVISYIQIIHGKKEAYKYIKKCFTEASNHLNKEGILQFLYLYSFSEKNIHSSNSESIVENLFELWRLLNVRGMDVHFLNGITDSETDAIVTYTKK